MLLLRSHGFSYGELASILDLNSASVGTLLSRAQQAFRKEYVKRYGGE
jgi:RNA polymerase sigma-70 factor (ECF subfamily)